MIRVTTALAALALALTACGGGSGGTALSPGGGNGGGGGGGGSLPSSVSTASGTINGADNTFYPTDGDSPGSGNGQSVDGVACNTVADESHYHVHFFLGFVQNGSERALPDGTGMKNPGADSGGVVNTASCFYDLHTHDASGIVHLESSSTAAHTVSLFKLGTYLDIWGQTLPSGIRIYTNGQQYTGEGAQDVSNSTYTQYSGDPRGIALYAHEVIWVEVGPTFVAPSALPGVHFAY